MSYAKGGEDTWLLTQFPEGFTGYAVELGAVDGTYISCTRLLEEKGWTCLCIEPNPEHQQELRACRKMVLTCACDGQPRETAKLYVDTGTQGGTLSHIYDYEPGWAEYDATVLTLDQCLMVSNFPRLDVLVLDVDGREAQILDGFTIERWKPSAVIIEHDLYDRTGRFYRLGYKRVGSGSDGNVYLTKTW